MVVENNNGVRSASASSPIYLDYNATTPLAPEVVESITVSLKDHWANPSSCYSLGLKSKAVIEASRLRIAEMLNAASPDDIIFTSGGTEANHLAILSATTPRRSDDDEDKSVIPHVITSNVEHDSIIKLLNALQKARSIDLSIAAVNKDSGVLDVEQVLSLITPRTCLITIMHANNETGVIMPISEIGQTLEDINRQRQGVHPRIFFHTDAAQTIGKIDVDVIKLKVDYLTVVGHKFYGPRIGALYARKVDNFRKIIPALHGGGQERGFRPGTENTCMINGLGTAASLVTANLQVYKKHMEEIRNFFKNRLLENIAGTEINFDESLCLPNTLSVAIPKVAREVLVDCSGQICASLGAACHSANENGSGVLISSGLSVERAARTIRFSVGRTTTEADIEAVIDILSNVCSA